MGSEIKQVKANIPKPIKDWIDNYSRNTGIPVSSVIKKALIDFKLKTHKEANE
jgi:hypothetical protein